jgi:nicotinamidase-related amidase
MNTALIVIDIQKDYFPGGAMELSGSEAAAAKAGRALGWFREKGWPVIHIQHLSVRQGAGFFIPDTPGVEFHPFVAPLEGETVIQKHFPNSFRGTGLQDKLDEADVKRLVIAGMMTHMCVDATARAACDLGYACTVAADACAAPAQAWGGTTVPAGQVHAAFLAALEGTYAQVLPTAELVK